MDFDEAGAALVADGAVGGDVNVGAGGARTPNTGWVVDMVAAGAVVCPDDGADDGADDADDDADDDGAVANVGGANGDGAGVAGAVAGPSR